jgi:hypothetical protein
VAYEDTLIKQIEEIASRTDLPFEKRLMDTAVWFHKNKDQVPREDLPKRLDFMEKTLDIMLELVAMSLERMQEAEKSPLASSSLYLPNGITMTGSARKFG